jgi:HSP90 family molecular chaperone
MQTSFTGLVSLLAKNLYTSSDAFIRELIRNAHAGCQRPQTLDPERHPRIDITASIPESR